MTNTASDAARRRSRSRDGRFAAQAHAENTGVSLGYAANPEVVDMASNATSGAPGSASLAAASDDPVIRALAADGWDLSSDELEQMKSDPHVGRVLAALTA